MSALTRTHRLTASSAASLAERHHSLVLPSGEGKATGQVDYALARDRCEQSFERRLAEQVGGHFWPHQVAFPVVLEVDAEEIAPVVGGPMHPHKVLRTRSPRRDRPQEPLDPDRFREVLAKAQALEVEGVGARRIG